MAVRYAKLEYDDVLSFLKVWDKQITKGAVYLQPGTVDGEIAAEPKLDLVVAGFGRVGPLACQVVHRAPDGGVGLQIPEIPTAARSQVAAFHEKLSGFKTYFVEKGELFTPEQVEAIVEERIAEFAKTNQATVAVSTATADTAPTQQGPPDPDKMALAEAAQQGVEPSRERGLKLPAVHGIIPDQKGTLGTTALRAALMQLAVDRTTGLLSVILPDGRKKYGFWSKGGPVGWRNEPVDKEEVLGVLLYRAGQITKEQLQESLEMMEREDTRQGEAFIEMGIMTFAQLVMVLQKQCEYVFLKVLQEEEGEWHFHKLDALPERFFNPAIKASNVLYGKLKGEVAELVTSEIYNRLRPHLDRYVYVRDEMKEVIAAIGWSKEDLRFLQLIQARSWRLREVFSVSNMSRRNTARLIWSLLDLDFVAYQDDEDMERYQKRISELIMGKYYKVRGANQFDVLEVHWICMRDDVDLAYKIIKDRYRASAFHDLSGEHKEALKVINDYIDRSYQAMRDTARRRAYREELVEKDMIINSAELLAKKGEMAIMRQDPRDAQACFGKAVELFPQNASFRDGLQRAMAIRPSNA